MFGLFNKKKTPRCGIYAIVNRCTGERYVGQSLNISKRWASHRRDLDAGTHHNEKLQRDWQNLGPDGFDFVVLTECSVEELDEYEYAFIREKSDYNLDPVTVGEISVGVDELVAGMTPEAQADFVENVKTITEALDSMTEEERADFDAKLEAEADVEEDFAEAIQDMDDEELEVIDRSKLTETMVEYLDDEIELRRASEQ